MSEGNTQLVKYPSLVDISHIQSMEDLLSPQEKINYQKGVIITGVVVEKRDDGAMVDIGFKSEGFIPKEEIPEWEEIGSGDVVKAMLEDIEDEYHKIPILSIEKAVLEESWKNFTSQYNEGDTVKGVVNSRIKGGFIVDVGIDAFLPGSQINIMPIRNLDELLHQELEFKILKINHERRNLVISRREILEEERNRKRMSMMEEISPGQLCKGVVKNITDFGAFIDLHGLDGLLHITDMSWGRVAHPSEMVSLNEEIEVVILDIDREKERISLGLKQKTTDPWESIDEHYPIQSKVKVNVVNIMPYGAFVELEKGIEGLIHISEMSWTKRIMRASDMLEVGQEVEVVILDFQKKDRKISLGLRQAVENPWEIVGEKYPVGSKVKGKIRNITTYGIFVEIEEDIDGMVHVSDMSWTKKISNPADIFSKGEEVEAVILAIDARQQRISLGVKQLTSDPWENIDQVLTEGELVTGVVRKLTTFGAFIQLENEIDGLVHISQISDERIGKIRDFLNIGDTVTTRVMKVDKDERRIALSIKATREESPQRKSSRKVSPRSDEQQERKFLKPGEELVDVGDILSNVMNATDNSINKEGSNEKE